MKIEKEKGANKLAMLNYGRMVLMALGTVRFGFYSNCMNALGRPILIGVLGYDEKNDPSTLNAVYGMVNFLFSVGAVIGTLSGGPLADKYGRRLVFYLSFIIDILNVAPMMIAHTAPLLISRTLLGISTGLSSGNYNILLAEVLPSKLRGVGSSLAIFFLTSSILLSGSCQNIWSFETLAEYWRYLLIYPLALEIVRVAIFPFLFTFDTPKYIYETSTASTNRSKVVPVTLKERPKESQLPGTPTEDQGIMTDRGPGLETEMASMASPDMREEKPVTENLEVYSKVKAALRQIYPESILEKTTQDMFNYWQQQKEEGIVTVGFRQLFSKIYRRQFFMGCFLGLANQLCGMPFIFLYSTILFDQISGNGKLVTVITLSTNCITSLLMILLTATAGRKVILVSGSFGKSLGMLLMLIGYTTINLNLILAAAQVYIIGFCVGLGGLAVMYIGETLPPTGVGVALSLMWGMNGILALLIPIIILAIGPLPLMIFFMIFCFCAAIFCWIFAIEPKNKTPKMIQEEYNSSLIHCCKKKRSN